MLYAVVQGTWVMAEVDVRWAPHVSYPPAFHLLLAALAVLVALVCLATTRDFGRRMRGVLLVSLGAAIPVSALGMASLPAYVVTLASSAGVESATGLAQVLVNAVGTVLLVLVAISYRRRLRGQCPRCGQKHPGDGDGPLTRPRAGIASKRTRRTVYVLMCGLLPWAGVKTIWTLGGDALGVTAEGWREINAGGPGAVEALAAVGIDVTVLAAAAGVLLLLGLMYPWGQVFPRWTLVLAGRRVPRLLPLLPAWLAAVGLSVYGIFLLIFAPLTAVGVLPSPAIAPPFTTTSGITWMIAFGGLAFGGLGLGLVAAAKSYATRTRPVCAAHLPVHSPADATQFGSVTAK
ncbi:hypothetical protein [Amycolatopsis sp. lyj-108]|uniref:hypothetical protein n=1 Tax=Amycolatopsis sp. lyj-108 TaxID=2789286 RepID=UPI00397A85E1